MYPLQATEALMYLVKHTVSLPNWGILCGTHGTTSQFAATHIFRDIFFWIDQARASGAPPDRPYPDQPPYLDHQPPHPGRQPQDQVHLKQES